jgi:hypothetical protein
MGMGKSWGIAQRQLESLWAILNECRKAAGKCPSTSRQPIGKEAALHSGYGQKHGNFHSFPLKDYLSVMLIKNQDTLKFYFKTLSDFSPYYFLSHHTTFSQAQNGATFPLWINFFLSVFCFILPYGLISPSNFTRDVSSFFDQPFRSPVNRGSEDK